MEEEIEEGELEEHEQPAQEHKRRPPAAKFTTASELLSYKKYLTGLRDRQKDSEAEGILQALLSKKVRGRTESADSCRTNRVKLTES
ncbi:unnamed protein product [Durusdinium trenchii]|uniref:Uncharacterized protein n=1 Tax=Durusdinium trenchii TaxID=1381693 RepID=A0ABP0JEA6_9DINO